MLILLMFQVNIYKCFNILDTLPYVLENGGAPVFYISTTTASNLVPIYKLSCINFLDGQVINFIYSNVFLDISLYIYFNYFNSYNKWKYFKLYTICN